MTNILIVDDSEQVRLFLSSILKLKGFTITLANDGIAAIEKYNEHRPDFIISDINMPNMGGFELTQYLHFHHNESLTLMTSTDVCFNNENQSHNPGVKGIVHKSIFTEDLETGVNIIIEPSLNPLAAQYG